MKARFLRATVIVLILLSLPALVLAQGPVPSTGSSGDGVGAAPLGSPDVLWDQHKAGNISCPSQYFTDAAAGWYSADDFMNAAPWNIESIFVDGYRNYPSGLLEAALLNWLIYPDAGGVPAGNPDVGGHLWRYSCKPSAPEVTISGAMNEDATLDIVMAQGSALHLPPGTYWLCFYPELNYEPSHKFWFWESATTTSLSPAQFIDPTGLKSTCFSWTPWTTVWDTPEAHDAAFRLEGTAGPPKPPAPPNLKYLHSTRGLFNLTEPVGTQWHELWPFFCKEYHLSSWNDTGGDGVLSHCDWIDMYEKPDGAVKPYHVEEVTITLNVTPVLDARGFGVNGLPPPMFIELEGGYDPAVLTAPNSTRWHEVYPNFCREYQLSAWNDTNPNGKLDPCDYILLTPEGCYGPFICSPGEDFSEDSPPSGWATDDWTQSNSSFAAGTSLGAFPPSGWTTDDWTQSNSTGAGGTSPEALLAWYNISGNYSYLDSRVVNTTSMQCLTLEFKSSIVDSCHNGTYTCRVYTRADGGDGWTDVTPWNNPIYGNVGPDTYSVDISSDIGSASQVRFEFEGNPGCLSYWSVDDITVCYPPPPALWHVEDVAIDIVVTPEPPPVGGEAYPVSKASLLAPWIAVGVLLAGGISWYVLRRRRAQS